MPLALSLLLSAPALAADAPPQHVEVRPVFGLGWSSMEGTVLAVGGALAHEVRLAPHLGMLHEAGLSITRSDIREASTMWGRVGLRGYLRPDSSGWFGDFEAGFQRYAQQGTQALPAGTTWSGTASAHLGHRWAWDSGFTATIRVGPGLVLPSGDDPRLTVEPSATVGWSF